QLYDYWFVQFDFPDANGKPYKSSGGKMVYNLILKREIPEGWEGVALKNVIKHINTGLNPRDNFTFGGDIKYITVKNLTKDGYIDFSSCDTINEDARYKVHTRSQIEVGDILYASICPLGRTYLITEEPKDWDINESVFSIRPNQKMITSEYLNMLLKDDYYIAKLSNSSTGSIFLGIRIKQLESTQILLPSYNILSAFTKQIKDIVRLQANNYQQILSLTKQRDELLLLLMNGQVNFDLSAD
ncbi:MAG: restriction endonuclease subunit S, partial [Paludibacteraceae bacterium]|nr:restriction endonuclease subunit S [Paludibacteraceae bacterium]